MLRSRLFRVLLGAAALAVAVGVPLATSGSSNAPVNAAAMSTGVHAKSVFWD